MACPFFWPNARHDAELWLHRNRLPLGDGFRGQCMAPGAEGREPSDEELKDFCNLGYASACPHIPLERAADAVHFTATNGSPLLVKFVMVKQHAPAAFGVLEFDASTRSWVTPHADPGLQRMAECFVEAWLARRVARCSED